MILKTTMATSAQSRGSQMSDEGTLGSLTGLQVGARNSREQAAA